MAYVIGLIALAAVALLAVVVLRRRAGSSSTPEAVVAPAAPPRPEPEPMTGLESALNDVVDREGRPMREHLDAETAHVDELRVPDDTGPLLRRALDHVADPGDAGETPGSDDDAR